MRARPWRSILSLSLLLVAAAAAFASIESGSAFLPGDVSLRRSLESTELAGLTAGTPVTMSSAATAGSGARRGLDTAAALQEAGVASAAALPPIPPARRRRAIRLKPGGLQEQAERGAARPCSCSRPAWGRKGGRLGALERLVAEAARLKDEADRAMREDGFTDAIVRRDDLMARRKKVLGELLEILAGAIGRTKPELAAPRSADHATRRAGSASIASGLDRTCSTPRVAGDDLASNGSNR